MYVDTLISRSPYHWKQIIIFVSAWGTWGVWSTCSAQCGQGQQTRSRICNGGIAGVLGCLGSSTEQQSCQGFNCGGISLNYFVKEMHAILILLLPFGRGINHNKC